MNVFQFPSSIKPVVLKHYRITDPPKITFENIKRLEDLGPQRSRDLSYKSCNSSLSKNKACSAYFSVVHYRSAVAHVSLGSVRLPLIGLPLGL